MTSSLSKRVQGLEHIPVPQRLSILELLLESAGDGALVVDAHLRVIAASPTCVRAGILDGGVPPEEWPRVYGLHLPDRSLCPYEKLPLVRALAGEIVDGAELLIINDEAPGEHWISIKARPLYGDDNAICGAVSIFENITVKKRTEKSIQDLNETLERQVWQLEEANRELKLLTGKLMQARDQAVSASRHKSEFLAQMSHEMRTPLNGLIGTADLLRRTRLSGPQREMVEILVGSAEALFSVINDVLDMSKIEAGRVDLELVEFEPRSLLEGSAELLAVSARENGVLLITRVDAAVPRVLLGDAGRIRQILLNLMSNAIKFSENGTVDVAVSTMASCPEYVTVRFEVSDTGIGMSPSTLSQLFKPFTQADGSIARRFGGTGLGLCISKQLVDLMDGQMHVTSKQAEGSTFRFDVRLERGTVDSEPGPIRRDMSFCCRVLIVSSCARSALALKESLADLGFQSDTAGSAAEALVKLNRGIAEDSQFDVVLVQSQLNDMDGPAFARSVRRLPQLEGTRMILLSTGRKRGECSRALKAGFSACLVSPVKQTQLYDAITHLMFCSLQQLPACINERSESDEEAIPQNTGVILVAEDNHFNQKVASLQLKGLGFDVDLVSNGREAVEAVLHKTYDLVLMDCMMPELDGFEATQLIRQSEILTGRRIPIVAMTAHAMAGDRERCLSAGMDDYVSKPVNQDKLKSILSQWLNEGHHMNSISPELPGAPDGDIASVSSPLDEMAQSFGNDAAADIVETFISSTEDLLGRLGQAVRQADADAIHKHAHELKGACGSMGATNLSRLGFQLEQMGRESRLSGAEDIYNQIERDFAQLKQALAARH